MITKKKTVLSVKHALHQPLWQQKVKFNQYKP